MTSEAPKAAAPTLPMTEEPSAGHTEAQLEEIGATGDWSQGVQDFMYKTPNNTGKKNSLLDRYPGVAADLMIMMIWDTIMVVVP
jgi:hypothetical protein